MAKNKGGRPLKVIDQHGFENLCGLQCTKAEICAFFEVTDKTLESWCKRTYGQGFSDVFAIKRGLGKISLRRNQWRLSEHSSAMAIFLGKQYLGQTETAITAVKVQESEDDALTKALKGLAKQMESEDGGNSK